MIKSYLKIMREVIRDSKFKIKMNFFESEDISGRKALDKLLSDYQFNTVLDIGGGAGKHAEEFMNHGKEVTMIDYGKSRAFENHTAKIKTIVADFNTYIFEKPFDCVWCAHCLEHQLNVQFFLEKINSILIEGGTCNYCAAI